MPTHLAAAPAARLRVAPSRGWPVALALLLGGCATTSYPRDQVQRLEERVDRIEAAGPGQRGDQGQAKAAQEQARRVDAKLAELQGKLDELRGAGPPGATARRGRPGSTRSPRR